MFLVASTMQVAQRGVLVFGDVRFWGGMRFCRLAMLGWSSFGSMSIFAMHKTSAHPSFQSWVGKVRPGALLTILIFAFSFHALGGGAPYCFEAVTLATCHAQP